MKYAVVIIAVVIMLGVYLLGGYVLYEHSVYTYKERLVKKEKRDWGNGYSYDVEEWAKTPNGLQRSDWFLRRTAYGYRYKRLSKNLI